MPPPALLHSEGPVSLRELGLYVKMGLWDGRRATGAATLHAPITGAVWVLLTAAGVPEALEVLPM